MKEIRIDGNNLGIEDVVQVARENIFVALTEESVEKIHRSRKIVDDFVNEEKVVYGITTGFGKFSDVMISKDEAKQLQKNLIMSHACGVGEPLPEETSRAAMLLRANALAKGFSGVRLETIQTLLDMLNKGVHPVIPEKGSLGASGDLAPLSHMVLVMMGMGEAFYQGKRMSGQEAMEKAGIVPVELTSKEGLGLINGTQIMTAVGTLCFYDAMMLMKTADIAGAMTLEALRGITDAFDVRIHQVRPHAGQLQSAANVMKLTEESQRTTRQGEIRVQDAYTLRCIPQVHGASRDALEHLRGKLEIEINSVTDNPIIFADEKEAISGGNFHGQPMALAFDYLGIAIAELANISERRIERLVNPQLSELPGFLTRNGGLNSGLMIAQYSAAALVSENKVLAHPASVDSIPSSANQEDHVSMGTIGARKAQSILSNAQSVIGIELMAAAQAIDLDKEGNPGRGTHVAYETLRQHLATLEEDRVLYDDIQLCTSMVASGQIAKAVEKEVGEL